MPRPARREQVSVSLHANVQIHFERYRSVFITSLLILWAFQLTPDRTKPFDDMGIIYGNLRSCSIKFKPRVPEAELRRIMEDYSEVL